MFDDKLKNMHSVCFIELAQLITHVLWAGLYIWA